MNGCLRKRNCGSAYIQDRVNDKNLYSLQILAILAFKTNNTIHVLTHGIYSKSHSVSI